MPKNIFCESSFIIQYILGNKIMAIILASTCTIGYDFIDEKFVETICQVLKI